MKARRGGTGSGGPSVSPSAATSDPARYRPHSGRRSRRARAAARRAATSSGSNATVDAFDAGIE